uniref:Uncharacterized protein n=1 Tax=Anguilla anguilla TaxID=7936 RepID=A0A0E9P840_ANGAN
MVSQYQSKAACSPNNPCCILQVFRRIFNSAHMEPFAWVLLYGVCFQGVL